MGTLYLVATPIGNLEDITRRALRILKQVDLIAAEDTRRTKILLSHYEIQTPVTSYHEHNKWSKLDGILAALEIGDVALVSDAGTPALNDPGYELVRACLDRSFPVSSIPGPSAPVAALVVSGLPTDAFLYLGYPPRRAAERRKLFTSITDLSFTLIFLETPHRLLESLSDLLSVLGDRQISVTRELTKIHEQTFRGLISEALTHFNAQPPRGEFTLVLDGKAPAAARRWSEERLLAAIRASLERGDPASRAAVQLATTSGWPRRAVYRLIHELQSTKYPREAT